jgi:hypothetical protein
MVTSVRAMLAGVVGSQRTWVTDVLAVGRTGAARSAESAAPAG